ncbi:hypothetical protein ABB27_07140 [Stenotrophomonas terrae]|uniref:Uncharacterized protein n=1 Tax=Stenotrophomonas terrae TaxID=405446 RepID=A0A0R0CGY5_9GAMM|nr:hypothetical protein [Stenotrophomonas terrae]KRG68672.1 hypothetical protein ABB27_07140 [Stenotrophomonas terrae]
MKTKYIAALALTSWLGVTGWLSSMVVAKPAVLRLNSDVEETAEMANARLAIDANQRVKATLDQMSVPSFYAPGPLIALAAGPGSGPAAASGDAAPQAISHQVSLVLEANGHVSAVVDGEHVRQGQRLSNGARVQAIGKGWVRLSDKDTGSQVYRVPLPGQVPDNGAMP